MTTIVIWITSQQSVIGPYKNKYLNRLQIFIDCLYMLLADFMVAFHGGGFISTD